MTQNKMVEALTKESLWNERLKEDCLKQNVFLAIRDSKIDFYHKGGRLFSFDGNSFKTHMKYAAVIDVKSTGDANYLTEADLAESKLIPDFKTNYPRIKENCSKYPGVEALGVSDVYHKHSYLSKGDIVVLDIEISFKSKSEDKTQDRIDLLLLDKKSQKLQFIEAKHYSNKEIWSTKAPDVIGQIKDYKNQVATREDEILERWDEKVTALNDLFGVSLSAPINIEPEVALLIFGFDANQRDGRLSKLVTENSEFEGIKCYSVGNIKGIELRSLWSAPVLKSNE